jgi:heat shock protein HspQ
LPSLVATLLFQEPDPFLYVGMQKAAWVAMKRLLRMIDRITGRKSPTEAISPAATAATFTIGDVVRHRLFPFRGVIFDVDPVFNNTDEWWNAIPEGVRPRKDQPFYHLLAENDEAAYVAYVSQQNLILDGEGDPVQHPAVAQMFTAFEDGRYKLRPEIRN